MTSEVWKVSSNYSWVAFLPFKGETRDPHPIVRAQDLCFVA